MLSSGDRSGYLASEMRPFPRQERYRRLERNRHGILDGIRVQQSQGICNMAPIVSVVRLWLEDIKSFLGQERYQRAISAGLPPTSAYVTHQEIAQYVQAISSELERMKTEEDGQTVADLARRGERLGQGQVDVNVWKEEVDEWIDEVEDRLKNEQGDEDAAAEWLSLMQPQVVGNRASDQKDREQLFQATKERLGWLRGRIRLGAVAMLPPAPPFHFDPRAVWILEAEDESAQGTAFALVGVGLVTCHHVLRPDTMAFQSHDWRRKWPIKVVSADADLDLAIVEIGGAVSALFQPGSGEDAKQLDQIAVLGFPNYRWGDNCRITPGHVVGHRVVSGIRRLQVSAPIIAGNSGGPVIEGSGKVIGVGVTGADRMEDAQKTENHGVIPIEALRHLKKAE